MVRLYAVTIVCRVDSMNDQSSIDLKINKELKMFKGFYKGKKDSMTSDSEIERSYFFHDLTMANSRRLKKMASGLKSAIQVKTVTIESMDTIVKIDDVSNSKKKNLSKPKKNSVSKTKSSSESDTKSSESDTKSSDPDTKSSESDTKSSESDTKSSESDTQSSGSDTKSSESDTESSGSDTKSSESDTKSSESDTKSSGSDSGSDSNSDSDENSSDSEKDEIEVGMMSSLPPNISRYGPNHDPYLDNFVPDLRAIAPAANFEMGFKTDPSVMALMLLSKNKSEKEAELAKGLLKEIKAEISTFVDSDIIGVDVPDSTANSILAPKLDRWFKKPHVKKAMEDLGIDIKKEPKTPVFNVGSDESGNEGPTPIPPSFPTGRRRFNTTSRRFSPGPSTPHRQDVNRRRQTMEAIRAGQRAAAQNRRRQEQS
jgi:hypothetical protein